MVRNIHNFFTDSGSLSILNNHFVGIDRLIDQMESTYTSIPTGTVQTYPPYNIIRKSDSEYTIEIACAGFSEEDLDITQTGRQLIVTGSKDKDSEKQSEYLHKGIGARSFNRKFTLADNVDVTKVDIGNGMLNIHLERYIPEELRPRKIPIGKAIPIPKKLEPELLTEE
jgi:molecular chaperone IbpA|tara:strand:+ start:11894 stop:12400 length:507 start_codon:yes stop_codon:yes gene_type:complete